MFDYAKEIDKIRKLSHEELRNLKRVRIKGKLGVQFGYSFAKNHEGWILEEITFRGVPSYRIFTGDRLWKVPQTDCEEIIRQSKE